MAKAMSEIVESILREHKESKARRKRQQEIRKATPPACCRGPSSGIHVYLITLVAAHFSGDSLIKWAFYL